MVLRAIAFAATAAAAVPLACTAFSATEDANGSDAATAPDAGASEDASSRDARPDAFSCASSSALCDDFDQAILGARWTGKQTPNSGTVTIEPVGLSLPNALRAAIPARTGSSASLYK